MSKTFFGKSTFLVLIIISILLTPFLLHGESGIYDRIGIIPEHGFHGAVPQENIDLFTGNLTLRFQDIRLPGPNGFDVVLWRVYNSKIMRDRLPGSAWGMQQEPYSWVGMGWTMHMGRVHNPNSETPVIEFPDGRWETAYPSSTSNRHVTRDFLEYDRSNYKLYFKDGTIWTFGLEKTVEYLGYTEQVRVVTRIENSYGHHIDMLYQNGSRPELLRITGSMGRTINFVTVNNRLSRIYIKNATGGTVNYYYTVNVFPYGGYTRLDEYDPPEIPESTYEYYNGQSDHFELTAVTTAFDARMEYDYADHTFYYQSQSLDTRVVSEKRIQYFYTSPFDTWSYSYPTYNNSETGTVTVDGPLYDSYATYHAYSAAAPWKIGLLKEKWFSDGSLSESMEWACKEISFLHWIVLNVDMGTIKAPLLSETATQRLGDAESSVEYLYERGLDAYGLPTRVNYYGGTGGTTFLNYKTLNYFFETNTTYRSKNMYSYVSREQVYSSTGTRMKDTQTTYIVSTGKYGAIDQIKQLRSGSTYLTWDYNYSSYNPNDITITINLPGTAGTGTYRYRYGVLSELRRPGYTEFTRTISSYNSAIRSETNRHGGLMYFSYDDLNRITRVDMPSGFNDITAVWGTDRVTITQGDNIVIKWWDGMGRTNGSEERGDGTILYYRKTLDAEGRLYRERKGCTDFMDYYEYTRNAAGNLRTITDPRGKITRIDYIDDQKTVTDAGNNDTVFKYERHPGLPSQLTDAANKRMDYTYDNLGRLTQARYNYARTHSYAYDGLDMVTSETHPETGTITYQYNAENLLFRKYWGGRNLYYYYNTSNQLDHVNYGDETVEYDYDTRGRPEIISSTAGWSRDQFSYNLLGSILSERQNIPGLGYITTGYSYDGNNNLASITYPGGKTVSYSNNGLNAVETATFNGRGMVDGVVYGVGKQVTSMGVSGNGTTFSASYNDNGMLSSASLKKATTTRYRADYSYDDVGNIEFITNTVPGMNASFVYDDLYRLTSASYTGGKNYTYSYDTYGNLTLARENGASVFSRSYASTNRISTSGYYYDLRGNMTAEPGYQYTWDYQNRLTTVKDVAGQVLSNHLYDERGLRLSSSRLPTPSITVTAPAEGNTWYRNMAYDITWTGDGILPENLDILLYQGETQISTIVSTTANDGLYNWLIPASTAAGQYTVVVRTPDGQVSGTSGAFVIAELPTMTVTSPNGGETWIVGTDHAITWTSTGTVGEMKIDYSTDNGQNWTTITTSTPNDGSFTWTVPDTVSPDCRVRVAEADGDPVDTSDNVFSIIPPPSITVTAPNGGETWNADYNYNITWTSSGVTGNVSIEYTTNNGVSWQVVSASAPNSGSFAWTVPDAPSTRCRVRVSDLNSSAMDTSDGLFTIQWLPTLRLTYPNGGENLEVASTYNITWNSYGTVGNVKIDLSTDNGNNWNSVTANTANTGSFAWTVPDTVSSACLVRVSELDGDPVDISDAVFSIVPIPVITVTSPNGGEYWQLGTTENITWTSVGLVGNLVIEYSTNGGAGWVTITGDTENDGVFSWMIPDAVSENCFIRVRELDGSPSDTGDAAFIIVPPPSLSMVSPNGGESLEVASVYTLTWDSAGLVGNVNLDYSTDNGVTWNSIVQNTANDDGFNWTVPDEVSESCRVRVMETDGDPLDTSDGPFGIVTELEQTVTVLAPDGGEILTIGSDTAITWNWTGEVGNVRIEYSTDDGETWVTAINSTENDGSYTWTVPSNPSDQCRVRVSGGGAADSSEGVFSIIQDDSPCGKIWSDSDYTGGDVLYGVTYGDSGFAAVGSGGTILTGGDGVNWTAQNSGVTSNLNAVCSGNGAYVAVGDGGTIVTGSGSNWTGRSSGTGAALRGAVYGNGVFIVVGDGGVILSSPDDGVTWTARASGTGSNLMAAGFGGGVFTAVGAEGTILTSSDGTAWQMETSGTNRLLRDAAYGNGYFVVVGEEGMVLRSGGGGVWETRNTQTAGDIHGAAYGNGYFVMVGDGGGIFTSLDGLTWSSRDSGTGSYLEGIGYGSNRFITVGEQVVLYSSCGALNPALTVTSPNDGEILTAGSTHRVTWASMGAVGDVSIEYSTDNGINWNTVMGSTTNDGRFTWTVPGTPSETCLVRVSETDGSPWDVSDGVFTILPAPEASITLIAPNGGQSLIPGSAYFISWTTVGTVENVFIAFSMDNGLSWRMLETEYANSGTYMWTVPDIFSDECLMRVGDSRGRDNDPADDSDGVFSIDGTSWVRVTAPDGGEIYEVGSTRWITWDSAEEVTQVMLEVSTDNGETWEWIAGPVENTNSYEWTVPGTLSSTCRVRVTGGDGDGAPWDLSNGLFSIVSPPDPVISVTYPNGGEQLGVGSTCQMTWASSGTVGALMLEYSTDNGLNWTEIAAAVEDTGMYQWTVPDVVSENCLIRVSDTGSALTDTSDGHFEIAVIEPPVLTVTVPNGGESWEASTIQTVTWTATGVEGDVSVEFSTNNGSSWNLIDTAPAVDGSLDWTLSVTVSENCLVRIQAGEGDGMVSDASDGVFSIVSSGASILAVLTPNGGETCVVGTEYEITWTPKGTDAVIIDYSTDGGVSWAVIVTGTGDDGSQTWTVPDTVSDDCLVRVSDYWSSDADVSDGVFSIASSVPDMTITLTGPNGGESLTGGTSYGITWVYTGSFEGVLLEYSTDGGITWTLITGYTENDGSFEWTVPGTVSVNGLVRICREDSDAGPCDVSDGVFSIDAEAQAGITVTSPNGDEILTAGTVHEVTWTTEGTVGNVNIGFSTDNGSSWQTVSVDVENSGSYEWTVPEEYSEDCLLRIWESDGDDGPVDISDGVFSVVRDTASCGSSWYQGYAGANVLNSIVTDGSLSLVVGNGGVIMTNSNGKSWTTQDSGVTADIYGAGYGNNVFYAVGADGLLLRSTSGGVSWEPLDSTVGVSLYGMAYGNSILVAVGQGGAITADTDGTGWSSRDSGTSLTLRDIAFGSSVFVAVGDGGVIVTSTNGVDWTTRASGTGQNLYGVTYAGNQFMVVGDVGTVLTSLDGVNWKSRKVSVDTRLTGIAYGNSTYVISGVSGKIITSPDGITWSVRPSATRNDLNAVVYNNLRFDVVGSGIILYAKCEEAQSTGNAPDAGNVSLFSAAGSSPKEAGGATPWQNSLNRLANSNPLVYNQDMVTGTWEPFEVSSPRGPHMAEAYPIATAQAGTLVNTYYVYSYDNKLLAEYDHTGTCVKNYIYVGGSLLAEYRPPTNQYYFYVSDQINTTRMVLDEAGVVVHSAAYGPYGDLQHTWVSTMEPKLKFSGKEREHYSQLDYFGARYYSNRNYRFLSVDPIINKAEALINPQLWNLYAYCTNNPITMFDPDGRMIRNKKGKLKFRQQGFGKQSHLDDNKRILKRPIAFGFLMADDGTHIPATKNLSKDEGWDYNCHGFVFGDKQYNIDNPHVPKILKGDNYKRRVGTPKVGDLAFWVDNGEYVHSAKVVEVKDNGQVIVEAKMGIRKGTRISDVKDGFHRGKVEYHYKEN